MKLLCFLIHINIPYLRIQCVPISLPDLHICKLNNYDSYIHSLVDMNERPYVFSGFRIFSGLYIFFLKEHFATTTMNALVNHLILTHGIGVIFNTYFGPSVPQRRVQVMDNVLRQGIVSARIQSKLESF